MSVILKLALVRKPLSERTPPVLPQRIDIAEC